MNTNNNLLLQTNGFLFFSILLIGGILVYTIPKDHISSEERRKLSDFPEYTFNNWITGKYTDSINKYYSDNFVLRNDLINLANKLKSYKGIESKDLIIFKQPNKKSIENTGLNYQGKDEIENDREKEDTTLFEQNDINPEEADFQNINSIILYKNRAIQIFGGQNSSAENYAKMVNRFKEEHHSLSVFCMAIPCGSDFYLPPSFNKKGYREKEFINTLHSQLSPSVKKVMAYNELSKHTKEYIQLKTDHHWSGRGAYYAYQAFCNSAGLQALQFNQLNRRYTTGYLGTMYGYTRSELLKKNLDTIEYFKIPGNTKSVYYKNGYKNPIDTKLYHEVSKGTNGYGVFLGADYPLMRVTSEKKNNKRILMIKDSYGNAFAPFLAAHYEEVFIIDYRYYNGSIPELIKTFKITDILFGHNVFVLNSNFTLKREKYLIYYKGYDPSLNIVAKKKERKTDTTSQSN